jgi:D-lactate dehydrogenase
MREVRVAVFSTKPYDRRSLDEANRDAAHELSFLEPRLSRETSTLAGGFPAVCAFVNDDLGAPVLTALARGGTRFVVLRSAGFNHVDLAAADRLGLRVARVPAYSPHAVAEHTIGLILTLGRKIHRAHNRVREGNFSLEGLLGFELHARTVGIVGVGAIGVTLARIVAGFGARLVAADPAPHPEFASLGGRLVALDELLAVADVVTLHCPLLPATHHLIDERSLASMKPGAMLVNTGRGALVDTPAAIEALKDGHLGAFALDVYEEEADLFFEDLSDKVLRDDVFARLLTFPNVLVTGHQAFFTEEALAQIAVTTIANLSALERGVPCENLVSSDRIRG